MDTSNFWWQSAGDGPGPGPDPGDFIGQSLRFRGGQTLISQTAKDSATYTWSGWVKLATNASDNYIFGDTNTSNTNHLYIDYAGSTPARLRASGSATVVSTNVFRDPSAWYHFVFQNNNGTATVFCNGEPVPNMQNFSAPALIGNMGIGCEGNATTGSASNLNGYMAAVYFIDGQALEPTAFGRYNTEGVWVPVDYDGTYGTNGFHLTFDPTQDPDPQVAIGMDSSPNGNHFTSSGFNTDPVGIFSTFLFADMSGGATPDLTVTDQAPIEVASDSSVVNAFDGNTGTRAYIDAGANNWLIWNPPTSIPVGSGLRLFTQGDSVAALWINNQAVTAPTGDPQWNTITLPAGVTEIESIALRGGSGSAPLQAVEINGTILVDNTGVDYDVMQDSPTQNYATLNPLSTTSGATTYQTLLNANLVVGGHNSSNLPITPSTIRIPPGGRYYCEWQWITGTTMNVGVSYNAITDNTNWRKDNAANWFCDTRFQFVLDNNNPANNAPGNYVNGGVASFEIDTTVFPYDVTARFNGANPVTLNLGNGSGAFDPDEVYLFSNTGFTSTGQIAFNFGQQPFLYQPDGTVPLQTQNLPEVTIPDGREHFRAITDTGANILTTAQQTFPNGLWWIKDRVNSNQHQLVDSVKGAGTATITPGSATGVNDAAYIAPAGSSVAWCWNVSEAASENTAGDLVAQVAANQTAGFSIVTYTGQTGANSVGHGLTQAPEFVMTKPRDLTGSGFGNSSWVLYHHSLGRNTWLNLNTTDGSSGRDVTDYWGTAANWNVITMGVRSSGDANMNLNAVPTVAYCWHSVPGYSAFGTYQGNGAPSDDGPFIYTGFRPAFVLTKKTNGTSQWGLWDSTRGINNPVTAMLYPDSSEKETTNRIDFLSNGFKPRQNAAVSSNSGGTYIYAAFAENPFGGSNVSPANAR